MKHVTLAANPKGAIIFDVAEPGAPLNKLPDPRDRRGKIYPRRVGKDVCALFA